MRQIIVPDGLGFVSEQIPYPVDVSRLAALNVVFVGETPGGVVVERDPFEGRQQPTAEEQAAIDAIFAEAEARHAESLAFSEPPSVPERVSAFQAFAAMDEMTLEDGRTMLDAVEAYMDDPTTPRLERLAFQKARDFDRDSPTIAKVASLLGLTSEQVDNLFTRADEIQA